MQVGLSLENSPTVTRIYGGGFRSAVVVTVCALALVASLLSGSSARAQAMPPAAASAPASASVMMMSSEDVNLIRNSQDGVVSEWRSRIVERARGLLSTGPVSYDPNDLLTRARTATSRMYDLGFAWRVSGESQYAERLVRELSAIASFPKWENGDHLQLGEMAHGVAVGLEWSTGYLSSSSRSQIVDLLRARVLQPMLNEYAKQGGSIWVRSTSNRNVVVNVGASMAAIVSRAQYPGESRAVLDAARESLQYGLQGFQPDGSHAEGITYWQLTVTYLMTLVDSLRGTLGTDWGLTTSPGVADTSLFATMLSGPSGRAFNYGDAWSTESFTEPLLGLAGIAGDSRALQRAIVGDVPGVSDLITPRGLLWYTKALGRSAPTLSLDRAFPDEGVVSSRSSWADRRASFVAFKATPRVADGHSDLDAGTLVYDALGVNWLSDLGADNYSLPDYFTVAEDKRWSYYRKRPEGQNTLVFDGVPLRPDATSSVRLIRAGADASAMSADLSSLAPQGASWKRGVRLFDAREQLLIQDEIKAAQGTSLWAWYHTSADISLSADRRSATLSSNGQQVLVRVVEPAGALLTASDASPSIASPQVVGQDANTSFRKLGVRLENVTDARLAVQLTPLVKGEALPNLASLTPIGAWETEPATTASADAIAVNGATIKDFRRDVSSYFVGSAEGDSIPQVSVTTSAGNTAVVVQAKSNPGVASVVVTKPGLQTQVYKIHIVRGPLDIRSFSVSAGTVGEKAIFDRNTYTGWRFGARHFIRMDLGVVRRVSHVEMYWSPQTRIGMPYIVETSEDGKNWRKVFDGTVKNVGVYHWASFNTGPIPAKLVKVTVNSDNVARGGAVNDLRILGDNDPESRALPLTPRPTVQTSGPSTLEVGATASLESVARIGANVVAAPVSRMSSNSAVANVAGNAVTALRAGQTVIVSEVAVAGWLTRSQTTLNVSDRSQIVLKPTADVHVQGGNPGGTSFRTSLQMYVRHVIGSSDVDRIAYLAFDLSEIPKDKIASATLSLTSSFTGGAVAQPLDARSVDQAWNPQTLVFNNRPPLGGQIGSATVPPGPATRVAIDVTSHVVTYAGTTSSIGLTQNTPPDGGGALIAIDSSRTSNSPTLLVRLKP